MRTEAKTLMRVLKVMSSKKLSFATYILQAVLKNNIELKEKLEMKENEKLKRSEHIVESVKHFSNWDEQNQKQNKEKEALHILIEACTYNHSDGDGHNNSVRKMLGLSTGTFYWNIIEQINGMDMTSYTHIEKNKREQTELSRKQEQYVLAFYHSDEYSTIDSISKRLVELISNRSIEIYVRRVWAVWTIDEQYTLFCGSDTVTDFNVVHYDFKTPIRNYFYFHRYPRVILPTIQSCVDIKLSSCANYMRKTGKYIRQNREIQQ